MTSGMPVSPTQKEPETDGKNLKKGLNLNQNSQKWAENKLIKMHTFGLTINLNSGKNLKTGIPVTCNYETLKLCYNILLNCSIPHHHISVIISSSPNACGREVLI